MSPICILRTFLEQIPRNGVSQCVGDSSWCGPYKPMSLSWSRKSLNFRRAHSCEFSALLWVDSFTDVKYALCNGIGHCRIRCLCVSHVRTSVTEPLPVMIGALGSVLSTEEAGSRHHCRYTGITAFSNSPWHFHFVSFSHELFDLLLTVSVVDFEAMH